MRDSRHRAARSWPDLQAFLAWKELGGAAPATLESYEWALARLLRSYPDLEMADFTDVEITLVLRTFPPAGRRTKKAAFDAWFKWAIRTRRLQTNPMDLLPILKNPEKKLIDVFSEADVAALTALPGRNGELFQIMFDCGLRKGEVRRLRRGDVYLDRRILAVRQGKGGKDRVVPLTSQLSSRLSAWFREEPLPKEAYLWPTRPGGHHLSRRKPMGETSFVYWYDRCIKEAGVDYRNPHITRHTFATTWIRRGGRLETLSRVMGHSSIKTTFDLYGHLDMRDIERDLRLVENSPDETQQTSGLEATTRFELV